MSLGSPYSKAATTLLESSGLTAIERLRCLRGYGEAVGLTRASGPNCGGLTASFATGAEACPGEGAAQATKPGIRHARNTKAKSADRSKRRLADKTMSSHYMGERELCCKPAY